MQIRQTLKKEIRNLSEYISSSTESALKEVITEGLLTVEDTKKEYKRKEMRNRQERWQNKTLHGQYLNDTDRKTDCDTSSDSKCQLCKVKEETIDHLVSSCSKIAKTDYKERHDKVASMLHWNLCRKYNH